MGLKATLLSSGALAVAMPVAALIRSCLHFEWSGSAYTRRCLIGILDSDGVTSRDISKASDDDTVVQWVCVADGNLGYVEDGEPLSGVLYCF